MNTGRQTKSPLISSVIGIAVQVGEIKSREQGVVGWEAGVGERCVL